MPRYTLRHFAFSSVKLLLQPTFIKKFEKVVDKCLQCEYNSILSSPKSERFSEAQRAGSKPFAALDALVRHEKLFKKVLKSA